MRWCFAIQLDELDAIFVNLNETEKQVFEDNCTTGFDWHDPVFTQSPVRVSNDCLSDVYEVD